MILRVNDTKEVEEIGPGEGLEALTVLKETTPTVEKKLLQKNIFHSTSTVHGHTCAIVIDGGSYDHLTKSC